MNWQTALLFWGIALGAFALALGVTVATQALGSWVLVVFIGAMIVIPGLILGLVTR